MANGNINKTSLGKLSETSKGDYVAHAKTINTNAAGKITENSKDGIFFGEPEKRNGVKDDAIDIIVGMFFDGTNNNKRNNELRTAYDKNPGSKPFKFKGEDSYGNAPTNIQKMEGLYPIEECYSSLYIEGVGTTDLDTDSSYGYGLGEGGTGIEAKVKKGCLELTKKLLAVSNKKGKRINTITIDVFGFSRGATCARHFISEITKPVKTVSIYHDNDLGFDYYYCADGTTKNNRDKPFKATSKSKWEIDLPERGELGQYFEDFHLKYKNIFLRFGGLFDSVSSFGVAHWNDVKELDLNAINKMQHTVHLTAADEHRDNFELTAITRGVTRAFPGVHSDIGGGYRDAINDKGLLEKERDEVVILTSNSIVEENRKRLIEQGWYKDYQLTIGKVDKQRGRLIGTRRINNVYSLIPLYLMVELSKIQCGVKMNQTRLESVYSIPENDPKLNLKTVYERLRSYAIHNAPPMRFYTVSELRDLNKKVVAGLLPKEDHQLFIKDHLMLMELRNRYLHSSANYGAFGMSPTSSGNRKIFNLSK